MSPRTVLYGLRNTRKQATDQQCPRPRPHTTAHWHRMHTSCDRQAAARIPIAFAPGTPALAFPAVSSPEACATPALRPWVIVVWVPVPGRYPTTLNRSGPSLWSHTHGFTTLFPKAHVVPNPHGCESGVYDFICGFTTLITRNTWRGMCSGSSALPRRQANQPCLQRGMRCRGQSRHQPRISMEPMVASPFVHASAFLLFFKQSKSCLRA